MARIRWRIAVPFIILTLSLLLALGVYLSNFFQQTYVAQLQSQLTTDAQAVAGQISPLLASPSALDAGAHQWAKILNARVTIIDPQGVVLAESDDTPTRMDNHLDRPEVATAVAGSVGHSIRYSATLGYDMLYTAIPLLQDGHTIAVVRVAIPLTKVQSSLDAMTRALVTGGMLFSVLAVILAIIIANNTSRPLEELTTAAERVAYGQPASPQHPSNITEIEQLVRAFNAMAIQIRQQVHSLEAEGARLTAVLGNMADGVLIVDSDGIVQLINPSAANLLGVASNSAGHPLAEVARPYQLAQIWQASQRDQATHKESFTWNKNSISASASPLSRGLPGHTLLYLHDDTAQQKVESMRRDFISNVSHELRTPLAALKVMVETLQDGAINDPAAAMQFLGRMEGEVDSLSLMVMELLELSKVESGQVPLERKIVDAAELLTPARDRLALQAQRAGLTLRVNLPDSQALPPVSADVNRVQQVLTNLLHNAIKFTPAGGTVECGAENKDGTLTFYVRDSGIGIEAENLERVFERFYKEDKARSGLGTGLGLSICRHIVAMHGGRIWVESSPGNGSTFWFTLG